MNPSKEKIYPLCYKIEESCPSCDESSCPSCNNTDCLKELSNSSNIDLNDISKRESKSHLFYCLQKYGDIYKKLDIDLFVNEKTNKILFPDNLRIQAKLNLYLQRIYSKTTSFEDETKQNKTELDEQDEKLMLFNILLNDKLREAYNRLYKITGFAEKDSLEPLKLSIDRIMDTDYDTEDDTASVKHDTKSKEYDNIGGKKIKKSGKSKKTRTRKPRKTKKNRKTKSKKNKNLK